MKHLLLFLFLFFQTALPAQPPESLAPYRDFFEKQGVEYQKWLDGNGLGQVLRVQNVEVLRDTTVVLYLKFRSEDTDTVAAQWEQLKRDYALRQSGASLPKELFHKMTWYFSIAPRQGQVRLFDTYDEDRIACFKCNIRLRGGAVRDSVTGCKSEIRTLEVKATDLSGLKPVSVAEFKKRNDKKAVFAKLAPWLETRYTRPQCPARTPRFDWYDRADELHFRVSDLCREVLTDEEDSWWCLVLCNCKTCAKRERLDLRIRYEETAGGFKLHCDVSASYGSGFYDKPRDNGYHDLEVDYKTYLVRYADKLKEEIRVFLSKP